MNVKILGDINPDDQALLNCEHINIITDDNDTNIDLLLVYDNVIMDTDGTLKFNTLGKKIDDAKVGNDTVVVLRSHAPPGTCKKLAISYMPILKNHFVIGLNYDNDRILFIKTIFEKLLTILFENGKIQTDKPTYYTTTEAEILVYSLKLMEASQLTLLSEVYEYSKLNEAEPKRIINGLRDIGGVTPSLPKVPNDNDILGFNSKDYMGNLLSIFNNFREGNLLPHLTNSLITRNINVDNTKLDWLDDPGDINLDTEKEKYSSMNLTQLTDFCRGNAINIDDCVEKSNIVDKILAFLRKNYYQIPFLNTRPQTIFNNIVPNPVVNTPNNATQNQSVGGQSGVPLQTGIQNPNNTKPIRNPFNMNVRANGGGNFMNLRPSATGRGQTGGGITFGGGVQSMRR